MISKTLADNDGLVDVYSFWTFTDIFEEHGQLDGVFHGGFGLMNYYGVAKPAYRCFRLFHETKDKRYRVVSSNHDATVEAAAFSIPKGIRVIAYNFNVAGADIKDEMIRVELSNGRQPKNISVQRIDKDHCNPKQCWVDMDSPKYINAEQVELLHKASELRKEDLDSLDVIVPANSMYAIDIEL